MWREAGAWAQVSPSSLSLIHVLAPPTLFFHQSLVNINTISQDSMKPVINQIFSVILTLSKTNMSIFLNNKLNLFNALKCSRYIQWIYVYVNEYFYNEILEYLVRKGLTRPRNPLWIRGPQNSPWIRQCCFILSLSLRNGLTCVNASVHFRVADGSNSRLFLFALLIPNHIQQGFSKPRPTPAVQVKINTPVDVQ